MLSFEAPTLEVVDLIQRWRDQVRREEKERERGLRLNVFALKKRKKKRKKKVTLVVRIGWRKTQVLRQLLTQCFLFNLKIRGDHSMTYITMVLKLILHFLG